MSRENELLEVSAPRMPCPFCGSKSISAIITLDDETKFGYAIACKCGASSKSVAFYRNDADGIEAALAEWNKRPWMLTYKSSNKDAKSVNGNGEFHPTYRDIHDPADSLGGSSPADFLA